MFNLLEEEGVSREDELAKWSCLGTPRDDLDEIWDEGSDFLKALLSKGVLVVVDPEFTHDEERFAEEILALCRARTTVSVVLLQFFM
jgi:hypothetical protein